MNKKINQNNDINFSLVLGGLFNKLFIKNRLDNAFFLYKRQILLICMFAWLPLLILAIFNGVAIGGVAVPFIYDIDVHVRFLISLPLLFFAEVIVHDRLQVIVQQFLNCNIISATNKPQFKSIIASAIRLSNSVGMEVFIIFFVITAGRWISEKYFPFGASTWYVSKENDMMQLTLTGYWYAFVSLPLFQFILLRWYYRMAIWYRFLWQVSRLPLQLNSLHPDRTGGIGFLTNSVYAFEPLLLAHSVLLSGMIINRIWNAGASLMQFQSEIICILVFLIILPLAPLMFFIFSLVNTKQTGTLAYDIVATNYVNNFRKKWIDTESNNSKLLLGTSDIQSLADLSNSYMVSSQMHILPFSKSSILAVGIITAFPFFPLIFTIIPLKKIISQTIGIIF